MRDGGTGLYRLCPESSDFAEGRQTWYACSTTTRAAVRAACPKSRARNEMVSAECRRGRTIAGRQGVDRHPASCRRQRHRIVLFQGGPELVLDCRIRGGRLAGGRTRAPRQWRRRPGRSPGLRNLSDASRWADQWKASNPFRADVLNPRYSLRRTARSPRNWISRSTTPHRF